MNIFTKHFGAIPALALMLFAAGCAKVQNSGENDTNKLYFDAWMKIHYPDAKPTGLGVYIIDDQPGTGDLLSGADLFVFAEHTSTDLDGNIVSTTSEKLAKQIGSYSSGYYYGTDIIINSPALTEAGVLSMLEGMRVGGSRTAVIPGWLNVTDVYDTEEEYLENCTGDDVIYSIKVLDQMDDIYVWEIDTLEQFSRKWMEGVDSTEYGYYYKQLKAPKDDHTLPTDTSFYINYTGRLMNGQVFDTTIKDTAKVYGIYSTTKEYTPMKVSMDEDYTSITMATSSSSSGSTLVNGFSYCLSNLKLYEKGIVAFYSVHGYGSTGKSPAIPKYAPISFEIEMVDEPE